MSTVAVIDYGIGNVFSVCNALRNVGADVKLTADAKEIANADRVILPGVGAFARAREALSAAGLDEIVLRYVETGRPFMGICIGMQLLMDQSTEFGNHEGLGLFAGKVERIKDVDSEGAKLLVPHISWAQVGPANGDMARWSGTPFDPEGTRSADEPVRSMYFVHSYHCVPDNQADLIATANYCGQTITAGVRKNNVLGVQFHPERSGSAGGAFLNGFLKL
jgi:imidazole glycerol-phosphate synthase subunit HisH